MMQPHTGWRRSTQFFGEWFLLMVRYSKCPFNNTNSWLSYWWETLTIWWPKFQKSKMCLIMLDIKFKMELKHVGDTLQQSLTTKEAPSGPQRRCWKCWIWEAPGTENKHGKIAGGVSTTETPGCEHNSMWHSIFKMRIPFWLYFCQFLK